MQILVCKDYEKTDTTAKGWLLFIHFYIAAKIVAVSIIRIIIKNHFNLIAFFGLGL
jgi:hypothetical protein